MDDAARAATLGLSVDKAVDSRAGEVIAQAAGTFATGEAVHILRCPTAGKTFVVFPLPNCENKKRVQIDHLNHLFAHVQIHSLYVAASFTGFWVG